MKKIEEQKKELKKLLKFHYGFDNFRPGQEKAIDNILNKKDSLVIMPTGGGKSLIYQLPALVLDGITIVVSPLISLMKDQVDSLNRIGMPATFINSMISPIETSKRIEDLKNGIYKLLYIAPERFYSQEFMTTLLSLKVDLFAIDEAHCISSWGHDFRPSYMKLKYVLKDLGNPCVVALTATATPEVKDDIALQLDLDNPEIIITGFERPNLQFGVIRANESMKPSVVMDTISSFPDQTGIIYVGTRARADGLLQRLLENDVEAVVYHAGMDPVDRKWVQDNFMSGKAKVIVATNAFGLGIDKSNTRFVIHYDMPGTVEAYYQEAGRAGRDGKPSVCLMLYNSRDRFLHEFFIKGDNPPLSSIVEIYEILLSYETETVMVTYSELTEMLADKLPEMAIGTSLKILEKSGLVRRSMEKKGSAFLKLNSAYTKIMESFGTRSKKQIDLFEKLYNKYKIKLEEGWFVNFDEIADIFDVKKDLITRMVKKLAENKLIEYKPPFRGTEIKILKRIDSSDVELDNKSLKEKLKRAYGKLDKIEDYVFTSECRQKYILEYFGDKDYTLCGKCDICLSGKSITRGYEVKSFSKFKKKKTEDSDILENVKPKSVLSTKLTQLETLDLYNKGLSVKKIAEERGITRDSVVNHLCFLIEKKLIKDISRLVGEKKQTEIIEVVKEVGDEKLKPIKEKLGDAFSYDEIKLVLANIK